MNKNNLLKDKELKELLDDLYDRYNNPEFIVNDPISIPHVFSKKEDIEISAFLTATLAWGKRTQIIKNAENLMQIMDYNPAEFIHHANKSELNRLSGFYYRTFQSQDALFFVMVLRMIYLKHGGLENIFQNAFNLSGSVKFGLEELYLIFDSVEHQDRSMKHIANVAKGSSAKRINMFLRWMIRDDNRGVDFGIWKGISAASLYLPLDVHSGRVARELGLLKRKQNDWRAVEEITQRLKCFDASDPVKYDFALFTSGVDGLI